MKNFKLIKLLALFVVLITSINTAWGTARTFKSGEKIYFKDEWKKAGNSSTWKISTNSLAAYFYGDGDGWYICTSGDNVYGSYNAENTIYQITVPGSGKNYTGVIFVRGTMGPYDENKWSKVTNQTVNLTPDESYNIFYVNNNTDNGKYKGTWGRYAHNAALVGEFNNWDPDTYPLSSTGVKGVLVPLEASTTYNFKILLGEVYYGINSASTVTSTLTSWWTFYSGQGNVPIQTDVAGDYGFAWNGADKTVTVYYPDALYPKSTYIYLDVRNETYWNANPFTARFYLKYFDSGTDIPSMPLECSSPLEDYVYYVQVPDNGYIGHVQLNRYYNSGVDGVSNVAHMYSHSAVGDNCLKEETGHTNYKDSWTPQWKTYCPPMSSASLSDNSTTKISWQTGNGTSGNPYLVPRTGTIKVSASATKAVPDNNMTMNYDFKVSDNGGTPSSTVKTGLPATTVTYDKGSLTNNHTYEVSLEAYNTYNGATGTKHTTSTHIWYKALTMYSVQHDLTNVSLDEGRDGDNAAAYYQPYSATYVADDDYVLPDNITVKFGNTTKTQGTDFTWDPSTGALDILADKIDGNVTVIIDGVPRWYVTGNAELGGWTVPGTNVIGNIATSAGVKSGYVDITLAAHTTYQLKLYDLGAGSEKYIGYLTNTSGTPINYANSGTAYTMNTYGGYNFYFISAGAGSYRFTRDFTNGKLTITYPDAYAVTYQGNGSTGGSVPTDPIYYGSGETVTVKSNDGSLAKTGYDALAYWNTEDDGSGDDYAVGSGTFTITADKMVYAKWTQTITLNQNGADKNGSTSLAATYKAALSTAGIVNPKKIGYAFAGWATAANGTVVINPDGTVNTVADWTNSSKKWIHDAASVLYAKWTSDTKTFTGATDKDWSKSTNWSGGVVPTDDWSTVTITRDANINDGTSVHVGKVLISSGSLTINAGGALEVAGTITKADGSATETTDLIVNTSDEEQASLILDNSSANTKASVLVTSTAAKVEDTYKFQFIAIPMTAVDVQHSFSGSGVYTYVWNEGLGWERRNYYYSLFAFEGVGITQNSGYGYGLTGTLATTANQTFSLTYTSAGTANTIGMNMIGNSWTSPIKIAALHGKITGYAESTVYIYESGTWRTYATGSAGSAVIPAMQAYTILATSGGGSLELNYDEAVRGVPAASRTTPLKAPKRNIIEGMTDVYLRVSDNLRTTDLRLCEDAQKFTNEFDNGWEARFLEGDGSYGQLYAQTDDKMTILATPDLEGQVVGFIPGVASEYTISFEGDGNGYYLNDLDLQESTLIEEGNTYVFTPNESSNATRFVISKMPISKIITGNDAIFDGTKARKQMIDGILYIIRDGRIYDATGVLVK